MFAEMREAGPEWRDTVGRMLDRVIDGLRYGAQAREQQPTGI